jgi:hypothetical protein
MPGTSYVATPIGEGTIAAARKACRTEAAKRLQTSVSKIELIEENQVGDADAPQLACLFRTKPAAEALAQE